MRYTQKQIDKFNRQKYITELEKLGKNFFRMFRDEKMNAHSFTTKFKELKKKLDERIEIRLDSEYHHQLKAYIVQLHQRTCINEDFDDKIFEDMRDGEMSQLNRLQKLKHSTSYRKDKHKGKRQNEDWG